MKKLALQCLQTSGMFALARALSASRARILMYHNFSTTAQPGFESVNLAALRKQLTFLTGHFQVVPLAHLTEQLTSGKPPGHRSVVLTVDDGRRNFYEVLFPLLKEYNLPATFYVVSSFVQGEDWLWTDKVLWLSRQASRPAELAKDRIDGCFASLNRLRPEARNAHIAAFADGIGVSIPEHSPPEYSACSWGELREMADSGLVEIGSHTVTHPILSSVTDEESRYELTVSRKQIEQGIGRKVHSFCFPNGKPCDFRPIHVQQVAEAGYSSAVITSPGLADSRTDPFQIPRIGISGRTDMLTFCKYIDGAEYYQARLRQLRRPSESPS